MSVMYMLSSVWKGELSHQKKAMPKLTKTVVIVNMVLV